MLTAFAIALLMALSCHGSLIKYEELTVQRSLVSKFSSHEGVALMTQCAAKARARGFQYFKHGNEEKNWQIGDLDLNTDGVEGVPETIMGIRTEGEFFAPVWVTHDIKCFCSERAPS